MYCVLLSVTEGVLARDEFDVHNATRFMWRNYGKDAMAC